MALYQHFNSADKNSTIAVWEITEDETTLVQPLKQGENLLIEAHKRFSSSNRRLEWLAVRRLLHEIGEKQFNISYLPSGKPVLDDPNYHISISHTRGYAAILLHHGVEEVGLDIEQIADKVMRVRHKFLSKEELFFSAKDNPEEEKKTCVLLWSAKETLYKISDIQGADFSEHLHIMPFSLAENGTFKATIHFKEQKSQHEIHYRLFSDFVMTFAIAGKTQICH